MTMSRSALQDYLDRTSDRAPEPRDLYVTATHTVHNPDCRHWQDDGDLRTRSCVMTEIRDYKNCRTCGGTERRG